MGRLLVQPDALAAIQARVLGILHDPLALPALPPRELDLTVRLLRRARLLGRVGHRLHAAGRLSELAPPLQDHLRSALVSAEARERAARWELDRVALAIGDATPRLVALKGCAYLLAGLPNAGGRSFADVDLLLPAPQLHEVERRLLRQGWRPAELSTYDEYYYRHWAHELPPMTHAERDVEVDLHHNLVMPTGRLRPSAELLLAAARPVPGTSYQVLAPSDMVLHAALHLFQGGEMADALRELVDIADLLAYFSEHEQGFWPSFWPRARQLGLTRPAFYALRYAQRWLGLAVPADVMRASAAGRPPSAVLRLMDWLVPRALFPVHPDGAGMAARIARFGLFVRSHWVRMPPMMLMRHLGYKAYLRVAGSSGRTGAA